MPLNLSNKNPDSNNTKNKKYTSLRSLKSKEKGKAVLETMTIDQSM